THLMAPAVSSDAVARAAPDDAALGLLLDAVGAVVLYLAAVDAGTGRVHARGFSPLIVGGEDPATGSAAGPLCAYTAQRADVRRLEIAQGAEMGRASRLDTALDGDRVRVGGEVAVLLDGGLYL